MLNNRGLSSMRKLQINRDNGLSLQRGLNTSNRGIKNINKIKSDVMDDIINEDDGDDGDIPYDIEDVSSDNKAKKDNKDKKDKKEIKKVHLYNDTSNVASSIVEPIYNPASFIKTPPSQNYMNLNIKPEKKVTTYEKQFAQRYDVENKIINDVKKELNKQEIRNLYQELSNREYNDTIASTIYEKKEYYDNYNLNATIQDYINDINENLKELSKTKMKNKIIDILKNTFNATQYQDIDKNDMKDIIKESIEKEDEDNEIHNTIPTIQDYVDEIEYNIAKYRQEKNSYR